MNFTSGTRPLPYSVGGTAEGARALLCYAGIYLRQKSDVAHTPS